MRNLSYENEFCMQFHFHVNQSHFHKNGFALRLALKQRHKGTRKWPIGVTESATPHFAAQAKITSSSEEFQNVLILIVCLLLVLEEWC